MKHNRRVLVLFDSSPSVLRGVARYNRLFGPWEFYRDIPYYREQLSRQKQLQRMRDFRADGVIAHLHAADDARRLLEKVAPGKPAVVSLHSGEPMPDVNCMVGTEYKVGQLGAEHLLLCGFTSFAFCGFGDHIYWSATRKQGFVETLQEAGYACRIYDTPRTKRESLWENEQHVLAAWLQALEKPVGLMACNDDRGREVCDACRLVGLSVPENVGVLGVGNHSLICELYEPTLSSVHTDRERAGYEAAKLLDEMMRGEQSITGHKLAIEATHITTRRSTDIVAIEDQDVAEAVRFIRNSFKRQISVGDVTRAVAVSRRSLERRFSRWLNRSIHDEIRRVQIEYICMMLRETTLSASQIALSMGLPDLDRLSRLFRKEMKMGPRAYRRRVLGDLEKKR